MVVTGIILDYLSLVSENPSPLPFLEKKNLLGGDIHPHPHMKPLYSKSFLQSTSTSLLIINPLQSRVAHRSFDFVFLVLLKALRAIFENNGLSRTKKIKKGFKLYCSFSKEK